MLILLIRNYNLWCKNIQKQCSRHGIFLLCAGRDVNMKILLSSALCISLLGACAGDYARYQSYIDPARDNPQELIANNRQYSKAHVACVFEASLRMVYEERWSDEELDARCLEEEKMFYKSVYYKSFGGPDNPANPEFRHNTARDVVRDGRAFIVARVRSLENPESRYDLDTIERNLRGASSR